MKIKPSTLVLAVTALILTGVSVWVAQTPEESASQQQVGESNPQDLFAFEEKQVQTLSVETKSEQFQFERDGEGKWQMTSPQQAPANDAAIAFLLSLLATGESDRSLTITPSEQADFGFDQPLATIELTLDNQEQHQFILGGYDFNRTFLYALADPPEGDEADRTVLLVSPNFENAIDRPLEGWQETTEPSSANPEEPSSGDAPAPDTPDAESLPETVDDSPSPEATAPDESNPDAPTPDESEPDPAEPTP